MSQAEQAKRLSTEARTLAYRIGAAALVFDNTHDATGDPELLDKANRYLRAMLRAQRRQARRFDAWWELRKEARR